MAETWSPDDLRRIEAARELQVAVAGTDGIPHRWTPIWVVSADGFTYVRSWRRRETGWFGRAVRSRHVRIRMPGLEADATVEDVGVGPAELRERVDAAYRDKYGHSESASMVVDAAAATTCGWAPPRPVVPIAAAGMTCRQPGRVDECGRHRRRRRKESG